MNRERGQWPSRLAMPWAASPAAWAQDEGGDSAPLSRSGETPPGVLRPAPEPSAQARHRPDGVCPKEGHKNYQKTLVPLPGGKAERLGVVQPGEEEALGRPYYVGNYIFTSFFYMSR